MKKFIIPMATTAMAVGLALAPAVSAIEPGSIATGGASKDNPQNGGMSCEEPVIASDITTYNCTLQAQQNGSNPQFDIVVNANEVLNLNLNGQTLTNWNGENGPTPSKNVSAIWVQTGGKMTITDTKGGGTISSSENSDANTPVINVQTGASLDIQAGALTTTRTNGTAIIYNAGDLAISGTTSITSTGEETELTEGAWGITNAKGGNLTISGGTFAQNSILPLIQNESNLTIEGGNFTAKAGADALIANSTAEGTTPVLTIAGGDFNTSNVIANGENGTATISGGTFSNPDTVVAYLAPGVEFNADGTVVAKIIASEEENTNPNTADSIALYATVAVLALLGLGATAFLAKKSSR